MKERPIIFSAPMVHAILDGRKTQTRRVMKPQPPSVEDVCKQAGDGYHLADIGAPGMWRPMGPVWAVRKLMGSEPRWRCPYGPTNDRLWVRETWCLASPESIAYGVKDDRPRGVPDPETGLRPFAYYAATDEGIVDELDENKSPWKSPIFMPRWASRITLEVTRVRVERLHDITENHAKAEGVHPEFETSLEDFVGKRPTPMSTYALGFKHRWREINGRESWDSNPWVWAITFKRIMP